MTEIPSQNATLADLLSCQRRRHALGCLNGRDDGLALADLAADVAALECDADPRDVPPEAVERVYLSLYHCHVPKLADCDVVTFDRDANAVALATENPEAAEIRQVAQQPASRRRA